MASHDILLINPYIHDFTAYDLWAKPLGLLYLAGVLRANGYRIHLLDGLDIHFQGIDDSRSLPLRKAYGQGRYLRQRIPRPPILKDIPRYYYRFGVPPDLFLKALEELPRPQAVLMTSSMTYWYPGLIETAGLVRKVFPETPLILGGIYASLLPDHAWKTIRPDHLITGAGEGAILKCLKEITGQGHDTLMDSYDLDSLPLPAFDLYPVLDYVGLMTSCGCPFSCPYCASKVLQPFFRQRSPEKVIEEILHWHRLKGVVDFAFYDDALLIGFEKHLGPILEAVLDRNLDLRFHTPNALHIREITGERAKLLFRSGFKTLRLGLETTDWERQKYWGGKVAAEEFQRAVKALSGAGFEIGQIEVYLLIGLPGQTLAETESTIREVKALGIRPRLAEYSPLPQTPLWEEACRSSRFPLGDDPLYHNNSLLPCLHPFSWDTVQKLKDLARG
ncbi:MAG: radical SAM protein [Thermodesulfobacteriota bacterium]